jgi:microcystin degradation protein MlrC
MDTRMRLAIADIGQETCHFTPVLTTVDTFRQYGLYEGDEILTKLGNSNGYIGAFLQAARDEKIDLDPVPLISGWGFASGPLTDETVQFFIDKIESGLKKAGTVDGFFFGLHGAAAAVSEPDVEGALLETARRVLGPNVPIVSPFDHHGCMTHRKIANLNSLVGHRTQPHHPYDSAYRAAKQLFAIVRGEIQPAIAWHRIPMITHQERFLTASGPMKLWFDRARAMEEMDKVIAVSPFPMQPWLDVPEGGWMTVVVTDNDKVLAEELSAQLAQMAWNLREQFLVQDSVPVSEAVQRAIAAERGLVILCDVGDNVFGGATGDSTVILSELLHQEVAEPALITVVDPPAVQACWAAGVGSTLALSVGGKLDPNFSHPLAVRAKVAMLGEGVIQADVVGRSEFDMGRRALLEIGNVRLVVTENVGIAGNHPIVYRSLGLDPAAAKIAVIKTASNFQYYAGITSEVIRVDSFGHTMSQIEQFNWQHLPRPIYPLDEIASWQATPAGATSA